MQTLKEIYAYREMIISLVRKDLRGRYKGSVLGFLWTFVNPLLQLCVYTLVFSTIMQSNIERYYLYLFVALVPWIFFSSVLTTGSTIILSQKSLVTKIYFPREILPIAYATSSFVNMLLCFIVVIVVVLLSGISLSVYGLLCLPVVMIVEYILALGVIFLTSAITVYFRDLEHILGILSMAWMFMTPIMYSFEIVPDNLKTIFSLNPMLPIIIAYRDILYYGTTPHMQTLGQATLFGVIILALGVLTFSKCKRHFAEEM